MSVNIGFLYS